MKTFLHKSQIKMCEMNHIYTFIKLVLVNMILNAAQNTLYCTIKCKGLDLGQIRTFV